MTTFLLNSFETSSASSSFDACNGHSDDNEQKIDKLISPLKILNLCANLSSHTTSIQIQIILNKFLQEITNAPYVFIVPILTNYEECVIQVIGDKILNNEMRFPMTHENLANNEFNFFISELNCNFRNIIEKLVGIEHNTLYFDIKELNKNEWSILSEMIPLDEISLQSSATGLTNCSRFVDDELKLPRVNNDDHLQISVFVCIAGNECCRIHYRYCIYETLRFTIGHLIAAIELDEGRRVRKQCQTLLESSKKYLPKIDGELIENNLLSMKLDIIKSSNLSNKFLYDSSDFKRLVQTVVNEAGSLADAEQCNLFFHNKKTKELVTISDHGYIKYTNNEFPIIENTGIAGHVADNGKLINVRNTIYHPMYNKCIDNQSGLKARNMLCFPIYDKNSTIGVAALCNKFNRYHFDKSDEEVAKAFSIYTTNAIINSLIRKSVQYFEAYHILDKELVIHHTNISDEEVNELVVMLGNLSKNKMTDLNSFTYRTRDLDLKQTFQASLQMFHDLDYINKFQIRPEKLARFLLLVQKGYRSLPFHNWVHAFTVAHFAYTLIMNGKLIARGIVNELQEFAFLLSAFCHDIDHRGLTNTYQKVINSSISKLHNIEGSVNERHHIALTFFIFYDDATNILENLTTEDLNIVLQSIQEFILATDLVPQFKELKKLVNLRKANNGTLRENKTISRSLIITCCDLSDQIKEWPNVQIVSEIIFKEFFAQGDLERQLGLTTRIMMDRQKAVIPLLQCDFISDVILPAFEELADMIPETMYLLEIIQNNYEHWQEILFKLK